MEKLGIKTDIKNIDVSASSLDTYTGTYELNPGTNTVITRDGKRLFCQATGQVMFELFAKNNNEFFIKEFNAQFKFNVSPGGVAESLTLFQNGQIVPAKKIKFE